MIVLAFQLYKPLYCFLLLYSYYNGVSHFPILWFDNINVGCHFVQLEPHLTNSFHSGVFCLVLELLLNEATVMAKCTPDYTESESELAIMTLYLRMVGSVFVFLYSDIIVIPFIIIIMILFIALYRWHNDIYCHYQYHHFYYIHIVSIMKSLKISSSSSLSLLNNRKYYHFPLYSTK